MGQSIKVLEAREAGKLSIKLSGAIDEQATYDDISLNGASLVELDLKDIGMISQQGIQKWVKFFESIPEGIQIKFVNCNVRVVNQINQFSGFLGGKKIEIESVYAPYFCGKCEEEVETLVNSCDVDLSGKKPKPPVRNCPECGEELKFDGIANKYFGFLKEE